MNKKNLEYFKELLTKQLEELQGQADVTVLDMADQADNHPDPLDRASSEAGRNYTLRIRDRESRLIKKIQGALDRIEEGGFGICETCGEDISIERLKARPVATHCIECKTKSEAMERMYE